MRRFFAYICILTAFWSCTKEEMFTEERRVLSDTLFDVYHSTALFSNVEDADDAVTLMFSDGSVVQADRSVTITLNCLERNLPIVSAKKGWWFVDGAPAGVSVTKDTGNKLSKLVCIAFDFNNVYCYLSNGNQLRIPSSVDGELWDFRFPAGKNPVFDKDVICEKKGRQFSALVSSEVFTAELCPVFSFRGISLHVGEELQRNGVSTHNFSRKITYTLTRYDNSTFDFEVTLKEAYPAVYINYTADRIHRNSYIDATIRITDPKHRYWDVDEFKSAMQIKGRGNSTWYNFPKQPYRLKLDEKARIFGMKSNKDWVLLANYSDKSLLRNQVGQKLAEIVRMSWVPESYNVDVYLNDVYWGSYDFTEHKEVAKHRIDIDVDAGDCYLEIEAKKDNPVWFDTQRMNIPIMFSDPEEPSQELLTEVKNYINGFETVLVSSYFDDPLKGYASYIDVDSFAKNFIVQELTKNIDADLFKSLFLVKRKGGKLQFYHVWDFDLALGNCNYLGGHAEVTSGPEGWYIMNHTQEGINTGWYYYLFKDPKFKAVVKRIWQDAYPELQKVPDFIDRRYVEIAGSAGRNFTKWPILSTYVWPNIVWLGDYKLEVDYMKDFYSRRLEWMNGEISNW